MRTTLDLDNELLNRVMGLSGEPTKKGAVEAALRAYIQLHRLRTLRSLLGQLDLGITQQDLERMRDVRYRPDSGGH